MISTSIQSLQVSSLFHLQTDGPTHFAGGSNSSALCAKFGATPARNVRRSEPWPFASFPVDMGLLGLLKKMKKDWDLGAGVSPAEVVSCSAEGGCCTRFSARVSALSLALFQEIQWLHHWGSLDKGTILSDQIFCDVVIYLQKYRFK